jgi:hypothetical protein
MRLVQFKAASAGLRPVSAIDVIKRAGGKPVRDGDRGAGADHER